jgi:hypothetical protein
VAASADFSIQVVLSSRLQAELEQQLGQQQQQQLMRHQLRRQQQWRAVLISASGCAK